MAMAALSPNSILASPIQVNPQVKTDIQDSAAQAAQDAQKTAKVAQTDTVTISAQALKMADDKDSAAKRVADRKDEQEATKLARDKAFLEQNEAQKNARKAYAVSA